MPKIILKFKGAFIQDYSVDQPSIRIGRREGNDIIIDNLAVSGNHAKIQKVNGSFIIVDLKSTNGTFVNKKKVVQAKLQHLDEITIGKHTLIFQDESQLTRDKQEPEKVTPQEEVEVQAEEKPKKKSSTQELAQIAQIQFIEPRDQPEVLLSKKLTIIGRREDADIRLKGPFSPKVAAFINRKPSGYSLLPEEKAKIKVNGELITNQLELSDGDVIEIGSFKLVFAHSSDEG